MGPPRHSYDGARPRQRQLAGTGHPIEAGAERLRHTGRSSFVMLVLGLLGGGLVCLLVVNTTLAANSIQINHLQQANAARTQRIQQIQQEIASAQSAAVIAKEARKLGMRTGQVPAFVDLRRHTLRVGKEPMR